MKFAMYQDCKSPHQMPLAERLVECLGTDEFRYVYRDKEQVERVGLGWKMGGPDEPWQLHLDSNPERANGIIECAEVLLTGMRDVDLFEKREAKRLKTFYQTERWFKPKLGILRLLKPSYFRMARQFVSLLRDCNEFRILPIGIHAAKDIARLCGLFACDLRCLFRAPKLDFERKPCGKIRLRNGDDGRRYCLDKMRMWGYFVAPSKFSTLNSQCPHSSNPPIPHSPTLRVVWVGRLLNWKRVDTIIRAVGELFRSYSPSNSNSNLKFTLDIYGTGPEEKRLKKFASKYGDAIKFYPPVPIDEVRKLMRERDVYVLSSNAYEGWGAVVSEALEEGMKVLGTYEAGSSATMLPDTNLFHAGDWRRLKGLLETEVHNMETSYWRAKEVAASLMNTIGMQ